MKACLGEVTGDTAHTGNTAQGPWILAKSRSGLPHGALRRGSVTAVSCSSFVLPAYHSGMVQVPACGISKQNPPGRPASDTINKPVMTGTEPLGEKNLSLWSPPYQPPTKEPAARIRLVSKKPKTPQLRANRGGRKPFSPTRRHRSFGPPCFSSAWPVLPVPEGTSEDAFQTRCLLMWRSSARHIAVYDSLGEEAPILGAAGGLNLMGYGGTPYSARHRIIAASLWGPPSRTVQGFNQPRLDSAEF